MKRKTTKKLVVFLVVLMMVAVFTGCEWLLGVLIAPDGYVYDAKTGAPLAEVTVELKDSSGNPLYYAYTDTNGYYTFSEGVEYGTFELSATKTGYIFTEIIVDITGVSQRMPLIGGFVPGTEVFSIVVFWDEDFADVDAYLTMPYASLDTSVTVTPDNFYSTSDASVADGFFPDTGTSSSLYRVSVDNSTDPVSTGGLSGTDLVAKLDIDNVGGSSDIPGGPETISVYTFPFYTEPFTPTYVPVAADRSGLPTTGSYIWVGTMEYYLDAWTDVNENKLSDEHGADDPDALLAAADFSTNAANPVVYIFDSTGQKGYFTLPQYMDIETASIVRINLFYDYAHDYTEYFQFLPNINAYASYDSIDRSLVEAEPIVIKGRSR